MFTYKSEKSKADKKVGVGTEKKIETDVVHKKKATPSLSKGKTQSSGVATPSTSKSTNKLLPPHSKGIKKSADKVLGESLVAQERISSDLNSDGSRKSDSIYMRDISREDLPTYYVSDLVPFKDPFKKKEKIESYYHGGYYAAPYARNNGILAKGALMEEYNSFIEKNPKYEQSKYIKEAQERRVKGDTKKDPFYSLTTNPNVAVTFAPRIPVNGKLPPGIIERIKGYYSSLKPSGVNINRHPIPFLTEEGEEVYLECSITWGPYSNKVIDEVVKVAELDLSQRFFGPKFGYAYSIKSDRGHAVEYTSSMGKYGATNVDYTKEKEVNIFGGVEAREIDDIVPVWGEYMNPRQFNTVVHQGKSSDELFNKEINSCLVRSKDFLKRRENGPIDRWRGITSRFGSYAAYKNCIQGVQNLFSQDKVSVEVLKDDNGNNNVIVKGMDSIPNYDMVNISLTIDDVGIVDADEDYVGLAPGVYNLKLNESQVAEYNIFPKIMREHDCSRVQSDAETCINKFIDDYDVLSSEISRDLY